jgi:hypothetical protein
MAFVPQEGSPPQSTQPQKPTLEPVSAIQAQKPSDPTRFIPLISIDVKTLPSKGLLYPENAELKYRPYTFGEIKKASQSKLKFKDEILFMLEGIETNFDKLGITLYDSMYLALLRNISSIKGAGFKVGYTCDKCNSKGQQEVELGKIEFKDIDAPKLPIKIDLAGKECHFYPLTLKEYFQFLEDKKEEDDIKLLSAQIKNLPPEESYELVEGLSSADDQELMMEVDGMLKHDLLPLKFNCKNKIGEVACNNPIQVELSGGEALITPFRKSKSSIRNRIKFG